MTLSRKQQKAETRQKLMQAVIDELASGRSFDALSLREVARAAGIAPTSFYRHFHDMDDLGLAVIEEGGEALRQLIKDVRAESLGEKSLIRASVETLFEYFQSHSALCRMVFQESISGKSEFRKSAEKLMGRLSKDLADYLALEADQRGVAIGSAAAAADAMVAVMFRESIAMLNKSERSIARQREAAITQLKMIMLGAEVMGRQ